MGRKAPSPPVAEGVPRRSSTLAIWDCALLSGLQALTKAKHQGQPFVSFSECTLNVGVCGASVSLNLRYNKHRTWGCRYIRRLGY